MINLLRADSARELQFSLLPLRENFGNVHQPTIGVHTRISNEESGHEDLPRCPHCEEPALRLLRETPKPSWFAVLNHLDPRCPDWYAELDLEKHRRYLMEEHGIDYEDWYLETQVESAMNHVSPSPPIQLYLPGMCSGPRLPDRILLKGHGTHHPLADRILKRRATKFNARSIRARPVPA